MINIAIYNRKFLTQSDSTIARDTCIEYIKANFSNEVSIDIYEDIGFGERNSSKFKEMNCKIKTKYYNYLVVHNVVNILETPLKSIEYIKSLDNYNCILHSILVPFSTDNELGKNFLLMIQSLYMAENEDKSVNISNNKFNNAKKGSWNGGQIPYGFKYVSHKTFSTNESLDMSSLVPLKKEIDFVIEMYNTYLSSKNLSQTHKILLSKGCVGKKGNPIQKTTVQSILSNTLYVKFDQNINEYLLSKGYTITNSEQGKGVFLYKSSKGDEVVAATGSHNGIIDSDTWLKVQSKLKSLAKKS